MENGMRIMKKILLAVAVLILAAWTADAKSRMESVVFVTNIHCAKCVRKISDNLSFEKGVKDLKVNLEEKTITVLYDPGKTSPAKLAGAIKKLGYSAEAVGDLAKGSSEAPAGIRE